MIYRNGEVSVKALALILVLILIACQAYGADQKTLDFCHEYIGEAIKAKPEPDRGFRAMPMPIDGMRLIHPIYRGKAEFSPYSTYRSN